MYCVLVDKLGLDLFRGYQLGGNARLPLSWFKAGVPHLDIPQDHAFLHLYKFLTIQY